MRIFAAAALVLALGVGPCPALAGGERPVSGMIVEVDRPRHIVHLGPMVFHIPRDVYDLSTLEPGTQAVVTFERDGDRLVATAIETIEDPQ